MGKSSETGKQADSVAERGERLPFPAARIDGDNGQPHFLPCLQPAAHGVGVRVTQVAQNVRGHEAAVAAGAEVGALCHQPDNGGGK